MVSAGLHVPGQTSINPFTRFGAHLLISFVSIACAMYFAPYFVDLVNTVFNKVEWKKKWQPFIGNLMLVTFIGAGMVLLPIANLFIIANGSGQVMQASIFLWEILPWVSDLQMVAIKTSWGQPPTYAAFTSLENVMSASIVLTFAHFFLMFCHMAVIFKGDRGAYGLSGGVAPERGDKKDKTNKTIDKNDKKQRDKNIDNFVDTIRFLLVRVGYRKDKLREKVDAANEKLDSLDSVDNRGLIAFEAVKIKLYIDKYMKRKKTMTADDISAENKLIDSKIKKFFEGSTNNGKGLGMPIKK